MAEETARVRKLTVSLHFLKHTLSSTLWPHTFTYLKMQLLSYPTATLIGVQSTNKKNMYPVIVAQAHLTSSDTANSCPSSFYNHHLPVQLKLAFPKFLSFLILLCSKTTSSPVKVSFVECLERGGTLKTSNCLPGHDTSFLPGSSYLFHFRHLIIKKNLLYSQLYEKNILI